MTLSTIRQYAYETLKLILIVSRPNPSILISLGVGVVGVAEESFIVIGGLYSKFCIGIVVFSSKIDLIDKHFSICSLLIIDSQIRFLSEYKTLLYFPLHSYKIHHLSLYHNSL